MMSGALLKSAGRHSGICRIEHERRFLVTAPLAGQALDESCHIDDRYIIGTRLRLRSVTPENGGVPIFKFCKSYGAIAVGAEPIVNIYLMTGQHAVLAMLPAQQVDTRRYHVMHNDQRVALDIFKGALAGLLTAEVEALDAAALYTITAPGWVDAEITDDPVFHGGHLATVNSEMLCERLKQRGQS